ncbi:transcriptional regulator [Kitasatospora phosalacinea]|uniref:Transcriptional regulator n=1 Tax=Kitasatospora phosalacinea TaxID=2065 RepID=A0A9W6QBA8_9ACTN|nr:AraC family transcriptional regulator [Kitasatospora phosalacinea]GLW73642.1 transcriptional regulator [Kitasatospora phosalacinea]
MVVEAVGCGDGTAGPLSLYEGADIEELHEVVSSRLSPHRLTILGKQVLPGRLQVFHAGSVGLYDLGFGAPVRLRVGDLPDFYCQLPQVGSVAVVVNGAALSSPLCAGGPGDSVLTEQDHLAVNSALAMSRQLVEEVLAVRLGDVPHKPLRFDQHVLDPADPAVQSWLALVQSFRQFVLSPLSRSSELGVRHFERLLVDTLLGAQPHSWSNSADRAAALLPSALRRATEFCDERAGDAVSVCDIAQAARVSVRTLREAFRTHLDTTPLAYLRRVRLDHAHHDLKAIADGSARGTVTEVACRWGFTHLGRFSAEYRAAYGCSPSETTRSRH